MKKLVLSALIIALFTFGCLGGNNSTPTTTQGVQTTAYTQTTQAQVQRPIRIGLVGPLTGDVANLGLGTVNAVKLAADEINANGGVGGRQIEIITEDGKCNGKDATDAANKLVNQEHVKAIVGGLCSGESLAAIPIAEAGPTMMISPCSSSPKLTGKSKYFVRDYPSDAFSGKVAAKFMSQKGLKKVGLLYSIDDYSVAIKDVFKKEAPSLGIQVVGEESFEHSTNDVKTQLSKLITKGAEGIYLPAFTNGYTIALKQAKELGFTGLIVGADAADDPAIATAIVDAPNFAYALPKISDSPEDKAFERKYNATYGSGPLLCGRNAYDAVYLFAKVMAVTGEDPDAMSQELRKVSDYKGASGTISIGSDGDTTTADYEFHTYSNGKIVLYNATG